MASPSSSLFDYVNLFFKGLEDRRAFESLLCKHLRFEWKTLGLPDYSAERFAVSIGISLIGLGL